MKVEPAPYKYQMSPISSISSETPHDKKKPDQPKAPQHAAANFTFIPVAGRH